MRIQMLQLAGMMFLPFPHKLPQLRLLSLPLIHQCKLKYGSYIVDHLTFDTPLYIYTEVSGSLGISKDTH